MITDPQPISSELHLPNGNIVAVSHIGTINLTADIHLKDVLVVPQFQYNLLSVAQLTKNTNCHVLFNNGKCTCIEDGERDW